MASNKYMLMFSLIMAISMSSIGTSIASRHLLQTGPASTNPATAIPSLPTIPTALPQGGLPSMPSIPLPTALPTTLPKLAIPPMPSNQIPSLPNMPTLPTATLPPLPTLPTGLPTTIPNMPTSFPAIPFFSPPPSN